MLFYIYDFFFGGFKDGVCLVWFSYLVNVAILFGPGFSAIVFFKLMFYLINIYEREGIRAQKRKKKKKKIQANKTNDISLTEKS